jgi:hypothetical protein
MYDIKWGRWIDLNGHPGVTGALFFLLNYTGMEPRSGVKPNYPHYKCGASSSMLARQNLVRVERLERSSLRWQRRILATRRHQQNFPASHRLGGYIRIPLNVTFGAAGGNRSLFSRVETLGTSYIPQPLMNAFCCQITWSGWQESNPRYWFPKPGPQSTRLHPDTFLNLPGAWAFVNK